MQQSVKRKSWDLKMAEKRKQKLLADQVAQLRAEAKREHKVRLAEGPLAYFFIVGRDCGCVVGRRLIEWPDMGQAGGSASKTWPAMACRCVPRRPTFSCPSPAAPRLPSTR